jgi:hypothetical protein
MDSLQNSKAGPSEARPQWKYETPKSRRSLVLIAILFSLGSFALFHLLLGQQEQTRYWDKAGNLHSNGWFQNGSNKTQYLLGVGKADITGYLLMSSYQYIFMLTSDEPRR